MPTIGLGGQPKKEVGGVSGNEACNNVKEASAGNEIRVKLRFLFMGNFVKLQTCPV